MNWKVGESTETFSLCAASSFCLAQVIVLYPAAGGNKAELFPFLVGLVPHA